MLSRAVQCSGYLLSYSLYLHLNKTPHPNPMLLCETKKRTHFRAFEDPQSLFSLKWHKVLKNHLFTTIRIYNKFTTSLAQPSGSLPVSSASPLWSRACPPASSMPVQGEAASLAGGEQGEGALLAGRSWHTSPGRRSRRRRGRRATATSLCPVTWGQCSTPTCRFSNVQFVHCKITQDKNILANWRVTLYSSSRSCNWVVLELIWTMLVKSKHYHSLCFVLMVWPRAALSETIAAL